MRWKPDIKPTTRGKYAEWHPTFALLPQQCIDGTWVWLERVYRIDYMSRLVDVGSRSSFWWGWCYRLPDAPDMKDAV